MALALRKFASPDADHYAFELHREQDGRVAEVVAQLFVKSTPEGERLARLLAAAEQLERALQALADRTAILAAHSMAPDIDEPALLDAVLALVKAVDP